MLSRTQSGEVLSQTLPRVKPHLNAVRRALVNWATPDDYDKVLDMNCTDSALLETLLDKYRLTACGICSNMENAHHVREQMAAAEVVYARPEDIPWRDNTFDSVLCPLSPALTDAPEKALCEALRVLKPGGQMVIATQWAPAPLRAMLSTLLPEQTENMRTRQDMILALESAGFQNVSWRNSGFGIGIAVGWKNNAS